MGAVSPETSIKLHPWKDQTGFSLTSVEGTGWVTWPTNFDPSTLSGSGTLRPAEVGVNSYVQGRKRHFGGLIFFGGGVPLYRNGKIVGALGVSGDTSCADHEIAKRVRNLNPAGGALADDMITRGRTNRQCLRTQCA